MAITGRKISVLGGRSERRTGRQGPRIDVVGRRLLGAVSADSVGKLSSSGAGPATSKLSGSCSQIRAKIKAQSAAQTSVANSRGTRSHTAQDMAHIIVNMTTWTHREP